MAAKIENNHQQSLAATRAHKTWEMERQQLINETRINEAQRQKHLERNRQKEEQERVHYDVIFF